MYIGSLKIFLICRTAHFGIISKFAQYIHATYFSFFFFFATEVNKPVNGNGLNVITLILCFYLAKILKLLRIQ